MPGEAEPQVRAWVDYYRDLGVQDFYRRGESVESSPIEGGDLTLQIDAAATQAPNQSVAATPQSGYS